jgi:hypothetical protein
MGVGARNQSIASGFGAAETKSGFWRFLTFFGRPAAPFRALARVEAALARRSDHPGFARRLWSVRAVKTISFATLSAKGYRCWLAEVGWSS